jgi:hypothetical protein
LARMHDDLALIMQDESTTAAETNHIRKRQQSLLQTISSLLPELVKNQRSQSKQTAARRAILDEIEAKESRGEIPKLDELVAKNDRKAAAERVRQYLPWELMDAFEKMYWEGQLEAMANPDFTNPTVLFRGLGDDIIPKDRGEKPTIFSTVLSRNQGTYTRRLRSLTTKRNIDIELSKPVDDLVRSSKLKIGLTLHRQFWMHSMDPEASSFISTSSDFEAAEKFAVDHTQSRARMMMVRVDPYAAVTNFASGFLESEHLTPLFIFPDMVLKYTSVPPSIDYKAIKSEFESVIGSPIKSVTHDYSSGIEAVERNHREQMLNGFLPKLKDIAQFQAFIDIISNHQHRLALPGQCAMLESMFSAGQ